MGDAHFEIAKGERLYFAGLKEMYPEKALSSDANFTMRLSYGSIGGYRPYDAAWYDYYSTEKGILEKENPEDDEFWVQPEILDLIRSKDFGQYANENGELQLCFLTNNDITGGNSGSPVFDKNRPFDRSCFRWKLGSDEWRYRIRTGLAALYRSRYPLCPLHDRQMGKTARA